MNVDAINIGLSEAIKPVGSVSAVAGKGLQGDRHFREQGAKPGQALTLIEAEALEDVGSCLGLYRRDRQPGSWQLTTR